MKVNNTGIGAVGLSLLLLVGCGGGSDGDVDTTQIEPTITPSTDGIFSSVAGSHTALNLNSQNSGFVVVVSPNGALYIIYDAATSSGRAVGVGQMTGSPSDFETTFDVYDLDTGLYFDTLTIKGALNSETILTIDESTPTMTVESSAMSGTFGSMKSVMAIESPPSTIPNKIWTTTEDSTSFVTDVQRDDTRFSFVDNLGCVHTGDLTPSQGSPHLFTSDDYRAFIPHAYDYRGTIQNCAADSFVGFVDLLSFTMPDGSGNLYGIKITVQSTGGIILATLE